MKVFPNAKINLGLFVTEKRPDGFHNLESVFYPLSLADELEIRINGPEKSCKLLNKGINIDCHADNNLIVRAYFLLAENFNLPGVEVHLNKVIPFGAGLGGGSSDASFMLKALNKLFDLKLSDVALYDYAIRLGSDCAFFIDNTPKFVYGRGELMEDIDISLADYSLLIIKPEINIPTKEAYNNIVPIAAPVDLRTLSVTELPRWKYIVKNDFENTLFQRYPLLSTIKDQLYRNGALYASMTGSGSALYGIFEKGKICSDGLEGKGAAVFECVNGECVNV